MIHVSPEFYEVWMVLTVVGVCLWGAWTIIKLARWWKGK